MLQLVTHKGENEVGEGKQQHAGSTAGGAEGNPKGKGEGWKKEGEVSLSGSMTRQVRYISFASEFGRVD
jgi:capping protein beta